MVFNFVYLALFVGLIWLVVLTLIVLQIQKHYNNLTRGVTDTSLKQILEQLLNQSKNTTKDLEMLMEKYDKIEKDSKFHIQKIGLLRFNPFKDTGGDQSFILALVDGNDTGVIISGLYARSGTRWYAKKVTQGRSEHDLSEEEKKALKDAKTTKIT